MNIRSLQQLHIRPAARKLFDSIRDGEVVGDSMVVDDLLTDGEVSRRQVIAVLRELEQLGCGKFTVGRKGHPSRFEWAIEPVSLARRLAAGEAQDDDSSSEVAAVVQETPATNGKELELAHGDSANGEPIEHSYVLRPGVRIAMELPMDLTPREAEVLANWVRNLSFQR